jgi:DNA-binding transcriptional MerR regulator
MRGIPNLPLRFRYVMSHELPDGRHVRLGLVRNRGDAMNELNDVQAASNIVWIEDETSSVSIPRRPDAAPETAEFTIRELAREFGVTLRALRFYENKGLVNPRRNGNARIYSRSDRSRLAAILAGKKLGFTLSEIRAMIAAEHETRDGESLKLTADKCLEQIRLLEKQQLNIKTALTELWRIHAGLSAEIVRLDRNASVAASK